MLHQDVCTTEIIGMSPATSQKRQKASEIHRPLLPFEEALAICLSHIKNQLPTERIMLMESLGRILREDVVSQYFIPPFNKSMMDGYAVKFQDVQYATVDNPVRLKVVDEAPAGSATGKEIQGGESIRIMTGAPVPKGADTIIMLEDTQDVDDAYVDILGCFKDNRFIIEKGKDITPGQVIINAGTKITPAVMGMIANCGYSHVTVSRRPQIGILSTGSELVEPGGTLHSGQIFDINGYSLYGFGKAYGADVSHIGIAKDNIDDIDRFIQSYDKYDILILSGGVSVGDYDVVHDAFDRLDVEEIFWRIKIKPGKPLFFGKKADKLIFGLPGNPVSAMTNFLLFLLPVIDKMTGRDHIGLKRGVARVMNNFLLKPGRRKFLRGKIDNSTPQGGVEILSEQKSGIFRPLVESDVLVEVHDDVKYVKEGDIVNVYYLHCD